MQGEIDPTFLNTIVQGDCVKSLSTLPSGCVDLAFADPPFNIGYDYDVYHDRKESDEYLAWTRKWIEQIFRVLKSSGTFWLAIGDEYAAEMKVLAQEIGFTTRSWVIWYYTFGVNCTHKFTRSHAHLFYFVKNAKEFTFLESDLDNRIPSARQLVYNDSRANPDGRLPDDTWILRPQDLVDCFTPDEDTWYFPRVAGTFSERAGFHGCQMPEQLLGRIIRVCSNPGDLVIDPFSGSATTAAVAKKLRRQFIGFELSPEYVKRGTARTASVRPGDPLDGAPEPLMSAPATHQARNSKNGKTVKSRSSNGNGSPDQHVALTSGQLVEAFKSVHDGYSLDRVLADPVLVQALAKRCQEHGVPGKPRDWNHLLLKLRKKGKLSFPIQKRTEFSWSEMDEFLFASEIAWRELSEHGSLDDILCDPELAAQFDEIAGRLAPGFTPVHYRWGRLALRKKSKTARVRCETFADLSLEEFKSTQQLKSWKKLDALPNLPGLYLITGSEPQTMLYVGSTIDLKRRLLKQFTDGRLSEWIAQKGAQEIRLLEKPEANEAIDLLGMQTQLIRLVKPALNHLDEGGGAKPTDPEQKSGLFDDLK